MVEKRIKNLEEVLQKFIQALQKHIRIEEVILFGSYGRGKPHDYSDVDIAIVSPDFEGGTEKDCLLLDRVARKIHPLLEAIPYTPEGFRNFESGEFVAEIVRTGRSIYKRAA